MLHYDTVRDGVFYHDVLDALSRMSVRFVIVGGVAVNLQGVPRFTADLDLAVPFERSNLEALGRALTGLGLRPRLPVPVEQLADEIVVREWIQERNLKAFTFQDPNNPLKTVDLLLDSPVPYARIEAESEVITAAGLSLRVASADVLISMKEATGRAQDASDVDALRRLKELDP